MIRVLLCYPTSFTVNTAWVRWVKNVWEREHPTEASEITPAWKIQPPDLPWSEYGQLLDAVVLVEILWKGKECLDERAAEVGRDALVAGKEVWVYRRRSGRSGDSETFARVVDIKRDTWNRARVLIRSTRGTKKEKKQP